MTVSANLRGDQGSFSFSSPGTPNMTATADTTFTIDAWEFYPDRQENSSRGFGWSLPLVTLGPLTGRGRFHIVVIDGTTPPVPGATTSSSGTMKLGVKGSSQYYKSLAQVKSLRISANATTAENQNGWYEFICCGNATTDTITVDT